MLFLDKKILFLTLKIDNAGNKAPFLGALLFRLQKEKSREYGWTMLFESTCITIHKGEL